VNIWLVNQYAVPPSMAGPPRHHYLARQLGALGHDVTVIASGFEHHGSHVDRMLAPGEAWRVGVMDEVSFLWLRIPPYGGNSWGRIWSMVRFGERVRSGIGTRGLPPAHVIMGSSPHLPGAWGAQLLAARRGVPFVLEIRDLWPQSLIDLGGYGPREPSIRALAWIEGRLYRKADAVVSVLPGAVEYIAARGGAHKRIEYVPNGVNLEAFPDPGPPCADGSFTIVYAGSHGIANALDTVLDAAKLLESELGDGAPRFRLVGDGVRREGLLERARREGIGSVHFEASMPKSQMYAELAKADAFVVSSLPTSLYRYGVSFNKLFESMAMARPTVVGLEASNNPIEEAGAGLTVPPGDARAMADAIKAVMRMTPEQRHAMGLRGRRFVEQHHDVAVLARRVEALLSDVVASRVARAGPRSAAGQ